MAEATDFPLVDLTPFTQNGSEADKLKAARVLCDSCHAFGFANIVGHGMSDEFVEKSFEMTKKLFDLPLEDKMKAPHPPTAIPHRGYSSPGLEKVYSIEDRQAQGESTGREDVRKIQDFKESYEVGSDDNSYQPNVWLPEDVLPGYRDFATKLYWEFERTCKYIQEAISLGLSLDGKEKSKFLSEHSGHGNQLRLLHYPEIETSKLKTEVVSRMPAHQDWSLFTLDFQDSTGGLELQDLKNPGTFVAAKPTPGACVLNVGDMLQRYSNGYFPSALHRVGLPPKQEDSDLTKARHCIIYFYAPDSDVTIEPLSKCITTDRPLSYEPVLYSKYGEWLSKNMY